MIIYKYNNYRKVFAKLFANQKKLKGSRWSIAKLGEQTAIQPSYLTNVCKERGHFSSDQIFAIGEQLGLQDKEIDYLDLLMQFERATHAKLKQRLNNELNLIRNEQLRADKILDTHESPLKEQDRSKYYLDPFIELIHQYLNLEHSPTEISKIAQAWQIPESKTSEIISFLQNTGLIQLKGSKWHVESIHQHLSRDSFLTLPHQQMKRIRALEVVQKLPQQKLYSYMGTMTTSEETRLEIQTLFLEFLKQIEILIRQSKAKEIYHIQFDLFPWLG